MKGFSDSILTVSIRIQGFDYFTEEFIHPKNPKYFVNLRKIKLYSDNGQIEGYLPTIGIGREIKDQMNFQSEVYMVYPDTLYFDLEKLSTGKIQHITTRQASVVLSKHDSLQLKKVK